MVGALHQLGIRIVVYLDDMLNIDGPVKGNAETTSGNSSPHTNWPGIYSQHKQECIHPNTGAGVPGVLAKHPINDDFSVTEESNRAETDSQWPGT